jgi:cleavage and polyadenylation specificity factor subunit 4
MELLVAPVEHIMFDIELALGNQLGAQPLPFPGMDKSGAAVCDFYVRSNCAKAAACPFRHIRGDKTIVCKHWLRGLCKKGDQCEFLHEYDMSKMPECYFYSRFNACHNKECPFLHIDPEAKIKDCPWYDRGFCRHGPNCRYRHMRRVLCVNYLAGFCPAGQSCEQAHPRFELPGPVEQDKGGKKVVITCHYCGEIGHKVNMCNKMPGEMKEQQQQQPVELGKNFMPYTQNQYRMHPMPDGKPHRFKTLDEITCFKCGENGHFANKCPKGMLAFLSNNSGK